MRRFLLILVLLPILIPFKTQILAKNTNVNDEDSLHDGSDSDNAPNSAKLSPAEPAKKTSSNKIQKRQVGIIYRDDQPVGILQPFKRSYRFIPVREELLDSNEEETQDQEMLQKRDLKTDTANKRNSNQHQKDNEKFGDKLKNILDDMGLIDDSDAANTKREMNKPNTDNKAQIPVNEHEHRNKRNEHFLNKNEVQNKQEKSNIVDLNENYDGGGGGGSDDDDEDKRIERQIRNKIKSLKDRVEREIEAMKQQQQDPDDWKRKKRGIENNLIDSENDNINPIKQADANLDPLIRPRRNTDDNTIDSEISNKETGRIKRRIDEEVQDQPQKLSDLSDSDLFGALPRDFDGELSRFKRVKRTLNQ